jgi:hypothetical protein
MEHRESAVNAINLDREDEAVKRFFLSLPADAGGSVVSIDGQELAQVIPLTPSSDTNGEEGEWTDALNDRRCDLIDKEIEGTITPEEARELHRLQQAMQRYRRRVAPLPLEDARRLHLELLRKAREAGDASNV